MREKPQITIPMVVVEDMKTYRAEDVPDEFLEAIRTEMSRPLSREQIVANELSGYIELAKPIAQWINDDWLEFARHMIKTVEAATFPAEEATAAMDGLWPKDWPPLPTLDELGN
jgi:hypothetical protein